MDINIDLDSILTPILGDNPAGESLKYQPVYDEIREARRADDTLGMEDSWEGDIKTSDWHKVVELTTEVLTHRSKDIQVAVWLLEALVQTEGFSGYVAGSQVLNGILSKFWDCAYPEIEDDDLDYRIGPLEFLNNKLSFLLMQVAITDPSVSPGYSMLDWQESRRIVAASASERLALVAEGKVPVEELESAATKSSLSFYDTLLEVLKSGQEEFERLDEIVDLKFGKEAPRLSEIRKSLEENVKQVTRLFNNKGGSQIVGEDDTHEEQVTDPASQGSVQTDSPAPIVDNSRDYTEPNQVIRFLGQGGREDTLWKDALNKLKTSGIKVALEMLLGAACSSQSIRDKTNCQILMAKLCLRAGKAELAKPIVDEIEQLITGLQLDKWESPVWLAEVYDTLYQCIIAVSDVDEYKAKELLVKICKIDVTKALQYK
jgi:type VI secretion system protein ImpA